MDPAVPCDPTTVSFRPDVPTIHIILKILRIRRYRRDAYLPLIGLEPVAGYTTCAWLQTTWSITDALPL